MSALKLGFKVGDVLALMRACDDSPDDATGCSVDMDLIDTERVRVEIGFAGNTISLHLLVPDLAVTAEEFFTKWVLPGLPCLCGARKIDGFLPCGH